MSIKIKDCEISNNGVGISMSGDVPIEIDNTKIDGNGKGIVIRDDVGVLISDLKKEVLKSSLDNSSKERLIQGVLGMVNSRKVLESDKKKYLQTLKFVGEKATDLFVQIIAFVLTYKIQ